MCLQIIDLATISILRKGKLWCQITFTLSRALKNVSVSDGVVKYWRWCREHKWMHGPRKPNLPNSPADLFNTLSPSNFIIIIWPSGLHFICPRKEIRLGTYSMTATGTTTSTFSSGLIAEEFLIRYSMLSSISLSEKSTPMSLNGIFALSLGEP